MNLSDVAIVYLAFGAPVAVYKYLQDRSLERRVRIAASLVTWMLWIPAAARLGYRYLTNAYFEDDFVSQKNSDALNAELAGLCESAKTSLLVGGCSLSMHDVRETLERYVGLTVSLTNAASGLNDGQRHALFEAGGDTDHALGTVCLLRRNRRRLERHQTNARRDFLAIFSQLGRNRSEALELGSKLALRLDDQEAWSRLIKMAGTRGNVWDPQPKGLTPATTTASAPLSTTTAVLSSE